MADVTISALSVSTPNKDTAVIPYSDGATTYRTSPAGIVAASPGTVLQAQQGIKLDSTLYENYTASPAWTNIPGLSAKITPKSTNSRILVMSQVSMNIQYNHPSFRTTRNGNPVYVNTQPVAGTMGPLYGTAQASFMYQGTLNNNSAPTTAWFFLDDPQTVSAVTYQVQFIFQSGGEVGRDVGINRAYGIEDNGQQATSNVVLIEIAG